MNCKNRIYFTNGKRQLYYLQDTGEFRERCLRFSGFTGKKSFAADGGNINGVGGKLAGVGGNIADAVGKRFYRLMGVYGLACCLGNSKWQSNFYSFVAQIKEQAVK